MKWSSNVPQQIHRLHEVNYLDPDGNNLDRYPKDAPNYTGIHCSI